MRRVMVGVVLCLVLLVPARAEASVPPLSKGELRTIAANWVTVRAHSSGAWYGWGVNRCWRLSRVRGRCVLWFRPVAPARPKYCRRVFEVRVVSASRYRFTAFRVWCRPTRF